MSQDERMNNTSELVQYLATNQAKIFGHEVTLERELDR